MEYNKDDNKPVLVQFENGPIKDKSSVAFQYLRGTKSSKRMLMADCGNMLYTGNVFQKQQSLVKYYVGVVDKNTCRVEDVQGLQLCTLKPKLRDDMSKESSSQDKTYRQKSDTLVEAFGSSKQKRLLSSRQKNENVNESVGEKVASAAKKMLLDKKPWQLGVDEELLSQIIPPMNMNAKAPSEVYNINDIIPSQDYQFLKEHVKEMICFDGNTLLSWKNEKKYPEYILRVLSLLPASSNERQEKGCCICYLNYLIGFNKITTKDLRHATKDKCPAVPEELKENIFERFTHPDSDNGKFRCLPQKCKDKLYCYIFVLALIIEDYDMNCNLLMKDLKLGIGKATKLLRAIGCTVSTTNLRPTKKCDEGTAPPERIMRAVLKISRGKEKSEDSSSPKVVVKVKKEPE